MVGLPCSQEQDGSIMINTIFYKHMSQVTVSNILLLYDRRMSQVVVSNILLLDNRHM